MLVLTHAVKLYDLVKGITKKNDRVTSQTELFWFLTWGDIFGILEVSHISPGEKFFSIIIN